MKQSEAVAFLQHLKAKHVSARGKWVQASCPLAPWYHDSGQDSSPSFAIRLEDNKPSYFNCFACKHGSLSDLVIELMHLKGQSLGMNLGAAYKLVEADEEQKLNLTIKDWGVQTEKKPEYVIPEWWLDTFPMAWPVPYAREYLESRCVDEQIAAKCDVRWDRSGRLVCFPVRNAEGDLVSMRGRRTAPLPGQPTYHVYPYMGQQNGQAWLGEHLVDYSKPVLMPESVFDYTSCLRVYDNCVSPMSVGINAERMKRMSKCAEVVTLFDQGKGGDKARAIVKKSLGSAFVVHLVPTEKDAGAMSVESLVKLLSPVLKLKL